MEDEEDEKDKSRRQGDENKGYGIKQYEEEKNELYSRKQDKEYENAGYGRKKYKEKKSSDPEGTERN